MRRVLAAFFFVFTVLFCPADKAEASPIRDVIYWEAASHLGEGSEALWITDAILYACGIYGVDPILVTAMMEQESGFQMGVISHAGAIGLMQLMPDTAAMVGVNPYAPLENIMGGVAHLRDLLATFSQYGYYGVTYAVAAYNAGSGAIFEYMRGAIPLYSETSNYVACVSANYERIAALYG